MSQRDNSQNPTALARREGVNALVELPKARVHLLDAAASRFSAEASAAIFVSAKVLTMAMSAAIAAR